MIDTVLSAPFLDPLRLMRIPAELEIIYLGSDRKELPLANFATLSKDSVTRFFQKTFCRESVSRCSLLLFSF